jgi:mycofactocin radical SAM maturase
VNVTWEITSKCNLSCRHCLSADTAKNTERELDYSQCRTFIDELDRMEIFQINFGGGEPFLREDFLDILNYAHSKRITTCVSTNGTVHDESLAKKLSGMDLVRIQVSLDGATAKTNDEIRGAGAFDKTIRGIELLKKHDFPDLSINTVVTSKNFGEIDPIYRLARFYGAKIRLSRFRPSGSAKQMWQEYHLERKQLAELSEYLSSHLEVLTGDSFFSITDERRRKLGLNLCGAARMTCSILPDGSVYPCAFLRDAPFRMGNITREPLDSIWVHSPVLKKIRNVRIEVCEDCRRYPVCHGGCPAVAYYLTKSLAQPDPECIASFRGEIAHHVETV